MYVIDCGQSVDILHPEANALLRRDLKTFLDSIKKYIDLSDSFEKIIAFITNEDEEEGNFFESLLNVE